VLWHGKKIAGAAAAAPATVFWSRSRCTTADKISRADWQQAMCETAMVRAGVSWGDFKPGDALIQRARRLGPATYLFPPAIISALISPVFRSVSPVHSSLIFASRR